MLIMQKEQGATVQVGREVAVLVSEGRRCSFWEGLLFARLPDDSAAGKHLLESGVSVWTRMCLLRQQLLFRGLGNRCLGTAETLSGCGSKYTTQMGGKGRQWGGGRCGRDRLLWGCTFQHGCRMHELSLLILSAKFWVSFT